MKEKRERIIKKKMIIKIQMRQTKNKKRKTRNLLTARFIFGHFVPAIGSRKSPPKAGSAHFWTAGASTREARRRIGKEVRGTAKANSSDSELWPAASSSRSSTERRAQGQGQGRDLGQGLLAVRVNPQSRRAHFAAVSGAGAAGLKVTVCVVTSVPGWCCRISRSRKSGITHCTFRTCGW